MQYEIQAYVAALRPTDKDITEEVLKAVKAMEKALNDAGLGCVIEVRDIDALKTVYKAIQACASEMPLS